MPGIGASVPERKQERSQPMADSQIVRRALTVENDNGLHMVPCSAIAKAAREFGGPVRIIHGKITADAASVFDLLGLGAERGTELILEADGDGADSLLDQLERFFRSDFEIPR